MVGFKQTVWKSQSVGPWAKYLIASKHWNWVTISMQLEESDTWRIPYALFAASSWAYITAERSITPIIPSNVLSLERRAGLFDLKYKELPIKDPWSEIIIIPLRHMH